MKKIHGMIIAIGLVTITQSVFAESDLGSEVYFDRKKGNCLSCHTAPALKDPRQTQSGTVGPPLIVMSARYPDINKLRAQIANPRVNNPTTRMPPYGPVEEGGHGILTKEELDALTSFVHKL